MSLPTILLIILGLIMFLMGWLREPLNNPYILCVT